MEAKFTLRAAFSVAKTEYFKWITNPRIIIVGVLLIFMYTLAAEPIMEDPKLLIPDEPMNGLDKDGTAQMRKYLLDLKQQGKTILIASHSAEDIQTLCDTVCEMDKGVMTTVK